jgi:hypothetical protein
MAHSPGDALGDGSGKFHLWDVGEGATVDHELARAHVVLRGAQLLVEL